MADSDTEVGVHAAIDSPPPSTDRVLEVDASEARQRLFELRTILTERFDRHSWDEYVRLRRARKAMEA